MQKGSPGKLVKSWADMVNFKRFLRSFKLKKTFTNVSHILGKRLSLTVLISSRSAVWICTADYLVAVIVILIS